MNPELCGSSGVVAVVLNDPFSNLLRKLAGVKHNLIGFYYHTAYGHQDKRYHSTFLDVVTGTTVPSENTTWISHPVLEHLLTSSWVESFICYPGEDKLREAMVSALARRSRYDTGLDIKTIYRQLLNKQWCNTGYQVINNVLSLVEQDPYTLFIPSSFGEPQIISSTKVRQDDTFARVMLVKLASCVIEMFCDDPLFSEYLLSCGSLTEILRSEDQLVTYLLECFEKGSLDIDEFRIKVEDLYGHRHTSAPSIPTAASVITTTKIEDDGLERMRLIILDLLSSIEKGITPSLDLAALIEAYNILAIRGGVAPIDRRLDLNDTSYGILLANSPANSPIIKLLPQVGTKLSQLNHEELQELLLYLDSQEDHDRWNSLMIDVTDELARRSS